MLKVEKKPEIKILESEAWDESTAHLLRLNEKQRKDIPFILLEFFDDQPSVSLVTKDVFKGRRKARFSLKSKKALRSHLTTLKILNTPELMKSIRKSEEELKAGRFRKYEEFARENGLL